MTPVSQRAAAAARALDAIKDFNFRSRYAERRGQADIADFTFGNPHEMPLPGLVEAIREGAVPQDKNWFAYKTSEEADGRAAGPARRDVRRPDGDRLVLPQCGDAERAASSRWTEHRRAGADPAARCVELRARAGRTCGAAAGRNLLPVGEMGRQGPQAAMERPRGTGRA